MDVVHVVSTAKLRGAEVFVADLALALGGTLEQAVVVIRSANDAQMAYPARTLFLDWTGPAWKRMLSLLRACLVLRRTFPPRPQRVFHANGLEALFLCVVAGVGRKSPLVYRRLGITPSSLRRRTIRSVQARLLRRPDAIIAVAEAVAADLVEVFGVPEERIHTIPRGIDPRRLDAPRPRADVRDEWGVPHSAVVVLSLGALTWEKDPVAALDVTSSLREECPQLVHVFVGDGPLAEVIEARSKEHLDNSVRLVPTTADVASVLAASDVLLLTSRIEGLPGVVIEAAHVGVPTVAYNVGGVREIVIDGLNGFVTGPEDRAALRSCVKRLVQDPRLRKAMGEEARSSVERFDIGNIARRHLDLYRRLTNELRE